MTQPINSQTWMLERNPYFWAVDTAGNQLPYLDKVQLTLAENPEVINLRAIAGEYDYMERFIDLAKLPVFLENAARGHYKVHLDPGFNGSDSELKFNFAYRLDPEIQKWFANLDFRRALALGIDRDQVNEAFFLGLGVTGTPIPADIIPESPGKDYRQRWATLDVAKANAMLDAIGLKKKDAEGFRLRTDNGERLRLQIDVAQTLSPTWPQQAEMIIQQWRAIGIWADMRLFERSLFYTRVRNDQNQIVLWSNNGSESLYLYTIPVLPIDPQSSFGGAALAQWYASNGAAGIKPTDPELLKGFRAVAQRRQPAGGKAHPDRAGNLEAAGRPGLVDRRGRPVAGLYGHAGGQRAARERAGPHLRLAALPHAVQRTSGAVVLQVAGVASRRRGC